MKDSLRTSFSERPTGPGKSIEALTLPDSSLNMCTIIVLGVSTPEKQWLIPDR
jgi:hypothetical protein